MVKIEFEADKKLKKAQAKVDGKTTTPEMIMLVDFLIKLIAKNDRDLSYSKIIKLLSEKK